MSEVATSASLGPENTTNQAVQNAEPAKEQEFQDDLHRLQFLSLDALIKERNDLVGRANAANGDRQTLTETIRDNSNDPQIVELRELISQKILELDALVKPLVDKTIEESAGDVNQIEEQIKEKDKTLKSGLTYFKSVYGDDAASFFSKQERLRGTQLRSSGGGRRIRGYDLTVTVDGEDRTFQNFSTAAKFIGVDTADLQREFFVKAETEDAAKLPPEVRFVVEYSDTDKDGNKTEKSAIVRAFKNEENASVSHEDSDDSFDSSDNDNDDNGGPETSNDNESLTDDDLQNI